MRMKPSKPVTEELSSIRILDLTRSGGFKERIYHKYFIQLGRTQVWLKRDGQFGTGWYLELKEPRPHGNATISLMKTSCHYGGHRYWFECPGCLQRAGVLYWSEGQLACRTCLGLGYLTQKMNYRTVVPVFRWLMEFEKMDPRRCRFHQGKPTRYTIRYEKLKAKVTFGMDYFSQKYSKK